MELKRAIEILVLHNKWRKGAEIAQQHPEIIGQAIDAVTEAYKDQFNQPVTWTAITPENIPEGDVFVASVRLGEEPPYVFGHGTIVMTEANGVKPAFDCIGFGPTVYDVSYFLDPGKIIAYAKTR